MKYHEEVNRRLRVEHSFQDVKHCICKLCKEQMSRNIFIGMTGGVVLTLAFFIIKGVL